jgi:pimeloyl-ACP methyl ester carboxylesterase
MRSLTIAAALCLCASQAVAVEPSFDGSWWGLLDTGTINLHLAFKLRHDKSGWSGEFSSPDQGPGWLPLSSVDVTGDSIKIAITSLHIAYEGRRVDKDNIKGTFTQAAPMPLDLLRGDVPINKHPQEPKPPFPYASEDVTVDNAAAGLKLGCTLTHPQAPHFPVVIFITGSGQQDRDESILGHKPFLLLADALARQGIGGLRCDDRGGHRSTGNFATSTTLDFAGDVMAELAWVKARSDVDKKHIGLLGHSEGGAIAPIVAARSNDVAFLVLLAGIGVRGDELIVRQTGLVARSQGADATQAAAAEKQERDILTIVMREKDDATAMAQLKAVAHKAGLDGALEAQLRPLLSPWYRGLLVLDPRVYLQKVKVPVLALNGTRDVQVPVENLKAIKEGLAADHDVTAQELPGLNHLFQRCQKCTVGEYGLLEETMAPTVVQLVVEWVHKHAQ